MREASRKYVEAVLRIEADEIRKLAAAAFTASHNRAHLFLAEIGHELDMQADSVRAMSSSLSILAERYEGKTTEQVLKEMREMYSDEY